MFNLWMHIYDFAVFVILNITDEGLELKKINYTKRKNVINCWERYHLGSKDWSVEFSGIFPVNTCVTMKNN